MHSSHPAESQNTDDSTAGGGVDPSGDHCVELVDTHCHLTSDAQWSQADQTIARAVDAGVTRLVAVACVSGEWDRAIELYRRHVGRVWVAAGIHPHDATDVSDRQFDRLGEVWSLPGMVGCGEMGLDYHYDFSPRPVQQDVFARQLRLARPLDLPIVIHCREAHADVVSILLDEGYAGRRVVFHCFSGTCEEAAELRSHGWWTSFTGIVTFDRSQEMQRACVATPSDALMFETDSPYLAPEPVRRMRPNEPMNLVHTVRFAAALRGESFEALAAMSTVNAIRFFGLGGATASVLNHEKNE